MYSYIDIQMYIHSIPYFSEASSAVITYSNLKKNLIFREF